MSEKILYFDCFSGASGDMILGALLDAGLDPEGLRRELDKLSLEGCRIEIEKVVKAGLSATQFNVRVERTAYSGHEGHGYGYGHGRHLADIIRLIEDSALSAQVKKTSGQIFRRMAEAEAKIHDTLPEAVHFHEVGAEDAIIDIVGAAIALEMLQVDRVLCSPLPLGRGTVRCEHGLLPVPAPAVIELLAGMEVYGSDHQGETVTPTGAAILSTLAGQTGLMPVMKNARVGYGAGRRNFHIPNLLRAILGQHHEQSLGRASQGEWPIGGPKLPPDLQEEAVVMLESNIDDLNPEIFDYVLDRLFEDGALDVFMAPVQMKKNRPGTLLKILCREEQVAAMAGIVFKETTTLGIRMGRLQRICLPRRVLSVSTEYGDVRVKQGLWGGEIINLAPEFGDCRERAKASGVPLKKVYEAALRAVGGEKKN